MKKSAPVVGDPENGLAVGIPLGAVTSEPPWLRLGCAGIRVTAGIVIRLGLRGSDAGVASCIRRGVQYVSVRRCSAALTWSVTAVAGPVTLASSTPGPAGRAVRPASATP